jgi:hypothetical protein
LAAHREVVEVLRVELLERENETDEQAGAVVAEELE